MSLALLICSFCALSLPALPVALSLRVNSAISRTMSQNREKAPRPTQKRCLTSVSLSTFMGCYPCLRPGMTGRRVAAPPPGVVTARRLFVLLVAAAAAAAGRGTRPAAGAAGHAHRAARAAGGRLDLDDLGRPQEVGRRVLLPNEED